MSRTSGRFPGLVDQDWRSPAACRSADPDLFFPISSSGPSAAQVAQAKAIWPGARSGVNAWRSRCGRIRSKAYGEA